MLRQIVVLVAGGLVSVLAFSVPGHAAPLKPPPVPMPMVPPPVAAQSGDPSNPAYAALFRRLSYLPPAELTATMQQTSEKVLEYLAGQQMVFTFIRQDPAFHAAFMAKALPHFRSVYEHSQNQCEPQISALLARSLSPADAVTVEAFMRTPLWAGVRSAVMGRFNASSASTASDEKLEVILERNLAKARATAGESYFRSLSPPQRIALARQVMTPSWQRFIRIQSTVSQQMNACAEAYGRRPEIIASAQEWMKPLAEQANAKYNSASEEAVATADAATP
ncbi:hypothetical protein [Novosphingobium pokkalii]|uniref:DUF2059 domain-containing protein n=1 Tax=Novosphingobium pokkalii TaxID=1770194 RepID=A0ABV7V479_9SPHN|nr:hypothetical protein [Novosphingobium pokkalii]GHC92047.1 hypothetical protein GCM10019060_17580 [Novosphingobium pokkalii]